MSGSAVVGILHPGEMGAAVGAQLVAAGHEVRWSSVDRSAASAERAAAAGLVDSSSLAQLLADSRTILSICAPAAAEEVATLVAEVGFEGTYVDCNAISPATAAAIGDRLREAGASVADGGIVGPPPNIAAGPRLYLSGPAVEEVAALFAATTVEPRLLLSGSPTAASAMKMLYAGWTKGSAALLLALTAAADRAGLADELRAEWERSQPGLAERLSGARADREAKGWRWVAEMEEVGLTLAELGEPDGFHIAAAEVFNER